MMKNRSRTEISSVIIESARSGATKTKIMYNAYLSHSQLVEYLKHLQQNDLITCEEGTQLYRPTEKGLKFLNMSNELNEMTIKTNSKNYNIVESQTPSS